MEQETLEEQKDVAVPQEKGAQSPSTITLQGFSDKVNLLIDEAAAAGLRPLPVLATILAKRGMGLFDQVREGVTAATDRFLATLESVHAKAEKK